MRSIIGGFFLTLDGVMQGPGGPTEDVTGGFDESGWVFKVWDEAAVGAIGALFAGEYDLLLGRRTYDIFAAHWPYVEGDGAAMGEAFTQREGVPPDLGLDLKLTQLLLHGVAFLVCSLGG